MRLLLLLRCAPITKIPFDHIFKKQKLKKVCLFVRVSCIRIILHLVLAAVFIDFVLL